jgi:hypothetical protein
MATKASASDNDGLGRHALQATSVRGFGNCLSGGRCAKEVDPVIGFPVFGGSLTGSACNCLNQNVFAIAILTFR